MTEPSDYKPKVKLPTGAPKDLAEFLACTRDTVPIDMSGDLTWLAKAFKIPDGLTPDISYTPTPGRENHGTLTIQAPGPYGATTELGVSIVDGQLRIEADGPMRRTIEGFADDINADLAAHGKCLDKATYDKAKKTLTLTKKPLPVSHGSAAGEGDETWIGITVARNNGVVPIRPAVRGSAIIPNDQNERPLADLELPTEIPARSSTLYELAVRLAEYSSSELKLRRLVGAPRAGWDSSSMVLRPVTLHYNSLEPLEFQIAVRATTRSLDNPDGDLIAQTTSPWASGTLPSGQGLIDLGIRFDIKFTGEIPPGPDGFLPIDFGNPGTDQGSFIQTRLMPDVAPTNAEIARELEKLAKTCRFCLVDAQGSPASWDTSFYTGSPPDVHPFLGPESWIVAGSDAEGCGKRLTLAILATLGAVVVGVIAAILTFGGNGDGDTVLDAVAPGDTLVTPDNVGDETPADNVGDENAANNAADTGETTVTPTSRSGTMAVSVVMLDLIGGSVWNTTDNSVVSSNENTVSAVLVFLPVVFDGFTLTLVGLEGVPEEQLDQSAVEVYQPSGNRQGCGKPPATAFVEGDISLFLAGWCGQWLNAIDEAAIFAYQNRGPDTLADYLGTYNPADGLPDFGTLNFDSEQDYFQLDVAGRDSLSIPSGLEFGGQSILDWWLTTLDEPPAGNDLEVVSVAGQDLGDGTAEVAVTLNGAFAADDPVGIQDITVRLDDGLDGSLFATYGFSLGELVQSSEYVRDLSKVSEFDFTVVFSPDGTIATYRIVFPPDFILGSGAQIIASTTSSAGIKGSQISGNQVGPVPVGGG